MEMELFVDKNFTKEATVLYVNQVIYAQASVDYNSTIQERVVDFFFIIFSTEKNRKELHLHTDRFSISLAGLVVESPQAAGFYNFGNFMEAKIAVTFTDLKSSDFL